jgi:hypothetical protein
MSATARGERSADSSRAAFFAKLTHRRLLAGLCGSLTRVGRNRTAVTTWKIKCLHLTWSLQRVSARRSGTGAIRIPGVADIYIDDAD